MMKRTLVFLVTAAVVLLHYPGAPAKAATQGQIDQAIQDGLAWLATQQNATNGYFGSGYLLANTATAVLAFENEGHFPGGGTTYSANVEKGLNFLFNHCAITPINTQTVGYVGRNDNPDSNGNGRGIFFTSNSYMYETGLVMQALVASNTPDRVVTSGPCAGRTYRNVMVDVVDFLAWAQTDAGPGRGGWRYGAYNNQSGYSDNSVAQWPVLGLVAAEQWGIFAPQFVKNEMEHWVTFIQNANGGSGYDAPNSMVNVSKTGGLLVEFFYLGDDKNTDRVKKALAYINTHWNDASWGWDGNKGHPYAMFSVFKGLELLQVTSIPNAPANPDTPVGDWWGDYSHYLVGTQVHPAAGLGYWNGSYYWDTHLATPWYIVILQATVFPVSVDVVVPGAACDLTGYDVEVHYSVERFTATGTLTVYRDDVVYDTVVLTDFMGSATQTYNVAPETTGAHTWKAVLEVTGGGISTSAEDTDTGTIYATPLVSGIPDQVAPFTTFDLDDFENCKGCSNVEWSFSGVPAGWVVTIDAEHVVTVVAPAGEYVPAEITFTAVFHWPGVDCTDSDAALFSPNRPPVAHPGKIYGVEDYEVHEGSSVALDGTQSSDPDGDTITFAWDLDDDGSFEVPGATPNFSALNLDGPSEAYVHLQVCDEHGACSIGTAEVEIENVAPTIDVVTAPLDPVNLAAQPVLVQVAFSDPGKPDTHVVTWNWGDGSSDASGATSPASASHTYAQAGVYTASVAVTDDDGGVATATFIIVVYDPAAGFVTGGGWIWSSAGVCHLDETCSAAEGKANFGFVSKYRKGATVPDGNTEFNFSAGNLNFHSSSYDWLVVTGSNYARYKGSGTVNGIGGYKFMLWAGDGAPDSFRIRIWTEDEFGSETLVYDNGFDQTIGGGNIVIHTAK